MRQGMFTVSGSSSTTSHTDILHLSISLFGKSSWLINVDLLIMYDFLIHQLFSPLLS